MKVLVAIDSFKGSLSSLEAGDAARCGILAAHPEAQVVVCPLADGGEGTVDALVAGMGGKLREVQVSGPLGTPVKAHYGIVGDDKVAVMEMAQAAGITLVPEARRDPLRTTTFGLGEMIRDAISNGCRRFVLGLGGSATNDGGMGMLMALGYRFLDAKGEDVPRFGAGLEHVADILDEGVVPELAQCEFRVACDVDNSLCGPNGCSAVFGPQKGAGQDDIRRMDAWLQAYASIVRCIRPNADPQHRGAGAAGGLGFAFQAFTNARLEPGVNIVLDEIDLEADVRDADVVVTGEGRLDGQTVMGKAPIGVARLAKRHGKRVVAFAGCVTDDAVACNAQGIDAFFPIARGACSLEDAMNAETARKNLEATAHQVFRLL